MTNSRILALGAALVFAAGANLSAQQPTAPAAGSSYGNQAAPPPAPAVGDPAPDFTAPAADMNGSKGAISLKDLRGKVVVLAFYPKDRSSGCTAELTKFRDEYGKMFGDGVVVLPVSLDDTESHVGWARDMHFPFALVSDAGGKIAEQYGSITPGKSWANRTVFVIGRDGRITYQDLHFGALDQHAYDALAAAVRAAQ